MAFIDSIEMIRDKATEAAQQAARTTKKLAEIAKANLSIYSEEDKIKKAQLELGKLYYRDYCLDDGMDTAEYLPWCQKIDESKKTIEDLKKYIEELKAERVEMEVNQQAAAENTSADDIELVVVDDNTSQDTSLDTKAQGE